MTFKQNYNTENRISSIAKVDGDCTSTTVLESWSYLYDGNGVRTTTMTTMYENGSPTGTTWTAYFFGGAYEVRSDSTTIKYYSFAGQTIMNDGDGLKYFLTDHLGSVVAITDEDGELLEQQRYLPFGGVRTIPNSLITNTDYGYTGQRNLDSDIGLMDYKARFYSPLLNRFIQPDSIVPNLVNPQAYNRFSYVVNNPINLIDPSGHCYLNSSIWIPNGQDGACSWSLGSNSDGAKGGLDSSGNGGGGGGGSSDGNDDEIIFPKMPKEWENITSFSETHYGWHDYTVGPNLVCPAIYHCTPEEMMYYLSRYAYPGQDPFEFVVDGTRSTVYDYRTGFPGGKIVTLVSDDGLMIMNKTLWDHVFYDGVAFRAVAQGEDGAWYISTRSYGNNYYGTAGINNSQGPAIFVFADTQMLNQVIRDHQTQFAGQ